MRRDGRICTSRRKELCVATQKIMHRDGKNSHFTAIFHPIAMHSTELSHEAARPERAEAPSPGRCPGLGASALSIIFALGKIKR